MQAWEDFLKLQEKELGVETVERWLRPFKILRFDACNLYLEAKDAFQALWFEEHIRASVESKFFNNNHKRIKVHLSVNNARTKQKAKSSPSSSSSSSSSANKSPVFSLTFEGLSPHANFDNFISSDSNPLAVKLLRKFCSNFVDNDPSTKEALHSFNPIYLHGGSGLGKTHLLMATAHELKKNGLKVVYSRMETFTEHVVGAIRAGEMQAFRQAYRNVDALLIDDVHILSRKTSTQEEFFHTFNTLHLEGRQIILTANTPPQGLKFIEPRLVSRFEWGIVLSLDPLNKQEMEWVLSKKAEDMKINLKKDVQNYLLENFVSSPKSLCQAFEGLVLRSHLDSRHSPSKAISLDFAKEKLKDLLHKEKQSAITPTKIVQAASEVYGIKVEDILGKSHAREYAHPRQIAMYLCRHRLNLPFMKIGDFFSRDHSTVMTSVKQVQKQIDNKNNDITGSLAAIQNLLQV